MKSNIRDFRFLLLLFLLPGVSPAADIYKTRELSEQQVQDTYTQILLDACHHGERDWKSSPTNPATGFWGDGVSAGNEGIRAIGGMVLASATLLKYDTNLSDADRRELLSKTTAALRYVAATHVTGTQKCPDGKSWGATPKFGGESWQSGMWTGTFAFGAWLIWDKLDAALQQDLQRVIASEDDILSHRKPPNGLWLDTKAEENGWEVPCLVLGELMFPTNAHAAAWHETAQKYMMNTLCTENDLHDTNLVDGRPVNEWVGGANIQPDFTLENHNIFHPSYVGCSSYFLTQAAMYYTFAGKPVPQAATHHLLDTWHMFETIMLPWGEAAYPQSMDWELHGLTFMNLFAALGTEDHDAFAARMERQNLQYVRAWQVMRQGDLAIPGSQLGFTRHSICAEQAAIAFLAHKIFGPAAPEFTAHEANAHEAGVWEYPYVDFIEHRTAGKFTSFSWKNRIMGMIIPIGDGHEGNPEFTAPIQNGLIGTFELSPPGDPKTETKVTVLDHSWKKTADGFETTGTVLLNGGRLKQTLKLTSLGEQVVVYEDHVTAMTNLTVKVERGVPVGIENDEISSGTRTVSDRDGETIFDAKQPRPPFALPGPWADVDGRLGVVMLAGSGLTYAQATGYARGMSVCADSLYGSYSAQPKEFKTGEEVARRVVVFYAETAARETSALAKSCKLETKPGGPVLHFKQPGGQDVEVPLL